VADSSDHAPLALLSVELSEPLPRLERTPAADGSLYKTARVLVQLHTVPLGLVDVPLRRHGTPPEELAHRIEAELAGVIAAHLRADGLAPARLSPASLLADTDPPCLHARRRTLAAAPAVTVVIPTRARPDLLMRCVASVLNSEYPAERIAVVVVDNLPPSAHTHDRVRHTYRDDPRVSYIRCDVPGSAAARNAGIEHATTEYLAMVDDDVIVDRHWLAELLSGLVHDERAACVTGAVLPLELETEAQTLLERYGGFHKGFAPVRWSLSDPPAGDPLFPYTAGRFGSGGNVAYRRSAIRQLGGYDPALAVAGEDLDIFIRVITGGWVLRYQPAALVWHLHRRDGAGLQALIHRYGIGISAVLLGAVVREPRALLGIVRRGVPGIMYMLGPGSAKNASQGEGYPLRLRLLELAGMMRGPFVYLHARRATRPR
jgi:GT2 family glycosyltransferase